MKKTIFNLAAIFAVLTLTSCASIKEVPEDYSAAQIIQMGQNAFETADYKNAANCYEICLERYGNVADIYVEAKYELAHVYLYQKKYSEAYKLYSEILELYEEAFASQLPAAYKKLANIGISQIPENKRHAPDSSNLSEEE